MFDRLAGLETEYVLRFRPRVQGKRRTTNAELFDGLLAHLGAKVPLVKAIASEKCWFLANGGGLRFEVIPFYFLFPASGFVEGSTPECRGAKDLLLYQRAQDVLLSQHAAASGGDNGDVALVKSSHDGDGHLFGCHENYEATIGSGVELLVWRVGLALMLPVFFALFLSADLITLWLVGIVSVFELAWCGLTWRKPGKYYAACLAWLMAICRTPNQLVGSAFVRLTAFRRLRPRLLPFLITRTIISGPGMVCPDGRLVLSPRATRLYSVCGMTAAGWRSVFYFCHIFKSLNELILGDWRSIAHLFRRRQRLQITIGDSNMAQFAEYLKVGTTLLVLDAIEAGDLAEVPRLRRPLQALRSISADLELQATLPLADGNRATALEIQRFYLNACRHSLKRRDVSDPAAQDVITLWEDTLDALEASPAALVGKLDWVTKKHLLDRLGPNAPVEEMRKLDLRYHELSRDGYYLRLEAAGVAPTLVQPEDVLKATTTPPEGTPATTRGRVIREFATPGRLVRASWSSVIVSEKKSNRVFRLS
jgi:proteasome accessory factor A